MLRQLRCPGVRKPRILKPMQPLAVKRTIARIVGTVLAVAIVQYTLAFASWSMVPGNAAPGMGNGTARIL